MKSMYCSGTAENVDLATLPLQKIFGHKSFKKFVILGHRYSKRLFLLKQSKSHWWHRRAAPLYRRPGDVSLRSNNLPYICIENSTDINSSPLCERAVPAVLNIPEEEY